MQKVKAWNSKELLADLKAWMEQEINFIDTNPIKFTPYELAMWILSRLALKQAVWETSIKNINLVRGER